MFLLKQQQPNLGLQRGFTMLELLIYIGIVSLVVAALSQVGFNVLYGEAKLNSLFETNYNLRFVQGKITKIIREAQTIDTPGGSGETTSKLEVTASDSTTIEVSLDAGRIFIERGTDERQALTSESIKVTNLEFTNTARDESLPAMIRIKIEAKTRNQEGLSFYDYDQTIFASAGVRASE
jgi:prepilin-type N-terminal cleavage/methylation domain-containing protein